MGPGPEGEWGWSEPAVSADRRAVRRWLWIGCLAVVASLLIFAVSVGILTQKYFLGGFRQAAERLDELDRELEELGKKIAALDEWYPDTALAHGRTADLTDRDLDRYLAVRESLTPYLGVLEEAAEDQARGMLGVDSKGNLSPTRMVSTMQDPFAVFGKVCETSLPMLEVALEAMEEQRMGPGELTRLAGIIEYGFLGREEAAWLTLGAEDREAYWTERFQLAMHRQMLRAESMKPQWLRGEGAERHEEEARRYRLGVEYLEEKARDGGEPSESSRGVLEERRAELENLPSEGVRWLGALDDRMVMMVAFGSMLEHLPEENSRPAPP